MEKEKFKSSIHVGFKTDSCNEMIIDLKHGHIQNIKVLEGIS